MTRLNESFLGKAFRGELATTEVDLARRESRSFESASDLLERIRRKRQLPTEDQREGEAATMVKRAKVSRPSARRQLISVLAESKRGLTPGELFRQAGYDEDSIEDFYEELRAGITAGKISEKRPNEADVYLEAVPA